MWLQILWSRWWRWRNLLPDPTLISAACFGVRVWAPVPLAHDRSLRKSSCQGWKLRSRSEAGSAYGRPRPGETGVWEALSCWSSGER